jgi:hypothetical protein
MSASLSSIALSLGIMEIGVLIGTLLYGMSLLQTYIYVTSGRTGQVWLKLMVAAVWCVHAANSKSNDHLSLM